MKKDYKTVYNALNFGKAGVCIEIANKAVMRMTKEGFTNPICWLYLNGNVYKEKATFNEAMQFLFN